MDFRKKLTIRLYVAIGYIALGIILIATYALLKSDNDFLTSYGLALIVIGIVRIRQYFAIMKNEETLRKQQIKESDERNIAIASKAKSISFYVCILLACVAIIVLEILDRPEISAILSVSVCLMLVIYYVTYWIVRKNS